MLFCESLVRNGHFGQFVFQWDAVGIRRCVVRLFLGVSDASVVAVEGQLCVRGLGCHLFAKCFLGHGVFVRLRIHADGVFAFLRKQFFK